jgi:flagellar hook protein FlgE
MYSGISGMKNFQTKLDIIGNNIANVNTFGFKKGRVTFKDSLNQMVSSASAAGGVTGGRNAIQVGLGSTLATVDTVHTNTNLQTTGRTLDLGIEGDGYFVLGEGAPTGETEAAFKITYTRSGNFYIDEKGYLVNADGLYVLAGANNTVAGTINIPDDASSFSIDANGIINVIDSKGVPAANSPQIALATFSNSSGLEKVGNNIYTESNNSGDAQIGVVGSPGKGTIASGFLEMSNVDLSEEFTEMIVAQRGFQANTRIITTSDEILQELVNLKR